MSAGMELLSLAQGTGARTIFVVGIGRNAGKTTTLRAIYNAAGARGLRAALASIGRDSEDALGADVPKPRLWLQPQTTFATARGALPRSPACRILKLSQLRTRGRRAALRAHGTVWFLRSRRAADGGGITRSHCRAGRLQRFGRRRWSGRPNRGGRRLRWSHRGSLRRRRGANARRSG